MWAGVQVMLIFISQTYPSYKGELVDLLMTLSWPSFNKTLIKIAHKRASLSYNASKVVVITTTQKAEQCLIIFS